MFGPERLALGREAELAAQQLAQGITSIGQCDHSTKGVYLQAFFNLTIGFERLAKLIILADHAMDNSGAWMTEAQLKKFGHDLTAAVGKCEEIAHRRNLSDVKFKRPDTAIHNAAISILSDFAKRTRYYNLNMLNGGKNQREPMGAWWTDVVLPILAAHQTHTQKAKTDKRIKAIGTAISDVTFVLMQDESGNMMQDVNQMLLRSEQARAAEQWVRLYVYQLARWLSAIFARVSQEATYTHQIEAFFGLHEMFFIFGSDDKYVRGRKTWSIYTL